MSDAIADRATVPTVYEWQANGIEDAAKNLAFWVGTTPEDKLDWEPQFEGQTAKGRTVYDQIHECAQVNRRFTNILKGEINGPWVEDHSYTSSTEAQDDLKASATELAKVVRSLTPEDFNREFTTARGTMSCSKILSISMNNMWYHGGQINQLQTLLGDPEYRYPEE